VARIDYFAIEQEIQKILKEDATLVGAGVVLVVVEEDVVTIPEMCPWVGVYIADRESAGSPITAGQQQRFRVRYEVWCFEHAMDVPEASKLRDDLIGKVEVALLKKPTLNGKVTTMMITGGTFDSGRTAVGFLQGGSIVLEIEKKATIA
jgi:hypothetical protein